MKVGNICTRKDRGEDKKPLWLNVGSLFYRTDEDKINIRLNMMPNESFFVFWNDDNKKGGDAPF